MTDDARPDDAPDSAAPDNAAPDNNVATPVRDEDAFDVEAVTSWLHENAVDGYRDLPGLPEVGQFPGGASNLTYSLTWQPPQSSPLTLILRRPPIGAKAKSAHDMGREYTIQKALKPVFPLVPDMVGHCTDQRVIGSDFYVMAKVDGDIPRRDLPWRLDEAAGSRLCANAWDTLVDLHSVDIESVPELAALGRGEGYVARQVAGWTDRLARAATDDVGDWSEITSWLDANQPPDVRQRLIHNDFRLDNLVLATDSPHRVVGVLDWEMATVGDPLMDLGGALAYWVTDDDDEFFRQFRRQPSNAPGMWSRELIRDRYCGRMGFEMTPEKWRFYEVFGLFRLAVIAQQIWYRYYHRQTTNEAYAVFGPAVAYLETRCRSLIGEA